jgi:hypothetical protein
MFLEDFENNWYPFFFKCLAEITSQAIRAKVLHVLEGFTLLIQSP